MLGSKLARACLSMEEDVPTLAGVSLQISQSISRQSGDGAASEWALQIPS